MKNRYLLNGFGHYNINSAVKVSGVLDYVSDKSYLHNYWGKDVNYLHSNLLVDYQKERDYGYFGSRYFQDIKATTLSNEVLLPTIDVHKEFFYNKNRFNLDLNAINIVRRNDNLDLRRLSNNLSWDNQYVVGNHNIDFIRRVRIDNFSFDHSTSASGVKVVHKNNVTRVAPDLEFQWRYPLSGAFLQNPLYLEPIVNPILSPNHLKNSTISTIELDNVELNDVNLFSSNRYSDYYKVEHGNRVNYGVLSKMTLGGKKYSFLLGQSYRQKKSKEYNLNSGLYDKYFSDVVGRVSFDPLKWLQMHYRFRVDSDKAIMRKQELLAQADVPINKYHIENMIVSSTVTLQNTIPYDNSVQLKKVLGLSSRVNFLKNWFVEGAMTRNYTKTQSFFVNAAMALGMNGQCTSVKFSAKKDFTGDPRRNIKADTSFVLDWEIYLENINK